MQLYPKTVDDSKNVIDLKKSRNANELIVVLGRINNALRLNQKTFSKRQELSKQYSILSWALLAQEELSVALQTAQTLSDAKRDKCVKAIKTLHIDIVALKKKCMESIHSKCSPMVDAELDSSVTYVLDLLRSRSSDVGLWNCFINNTVYSLLTFKSFENSNGFISPKLYVLLEKGENGILYISIPTNPFILSERFSFTGRTDLLDKLKSLLDFETFKSPNITPSRILKLDGVKGVRLDGQSLVIDLESNVLPNELNNILRISVPMIRKAIKVEEFEVLHRLNPEKTQIEFTLGSRRIADAVALRKMIRAFGLNKNQVAALGSFMEAV